MSRNALTEVFAQRMAFVIVSMGKLFWLIGSSDQSGSSSSNFLTLLFFMSIGTLVMTAAFRVSLLRQNRGSFMSTQVSP